MTIPMKATADDREIIVVRDREVNGKVFVGITDGKVFARIRLDSAEAREIGKYLISQAEEVDAIARGER